MPEYEINYNQLFRYLINGYKSLYKNKQESFFKEVIEDDLLPFLDDKNKYITDENLSFDYCLKRVKNLLIESIENKLNRNDDIAFCISGGIDSNSILGIVKNVLSYKNICGFTITSKDKKYDESEIVNKVVNEYKIKHKFINLDKSNFINNLKTIIKHHKFPLATISYYVHWLMLREINKEGYSVVVSGEGGDELFAGYYDHWLYYLSELKKNNISEYRIVFKDWINYILPNIRNQYLQDFVLFEENPYFRKHLYFDFEKYLLVNWKEDFYESIYSRNNLRNRMLNEMFNETIPLALKQEGSNAEYFLLKGESPFIDKELFEFANKIPTKYLLRNGYSKAILRNAMKGIIPDFILDNRQKIGFNVELRELFDMTDKRNLNWFFNNSDIWDFIDKDKVRLLIFKQNLTGEENKFLFGIINTKIFLEEFA